jgi:hypothetical protein
MFGLEKRKYTPRERLPLNPEVRINLIRSKLDSRVIKPQDLLDKYNKRIEKIDRIQKDLEK